MLVIKSFCMVGGGFTVGSEFLQKFGSWYFWREEKKLFIANLRSKYKSLIHYKQLVWVSKVYSFLTALMSVQKKMKYVVLPKKNRSLWGCSHDQHSSKPTSCCRIFCFNSMRWMSQCILINSSSAVWLLSSVRPSNVNKFCFKALKADTWG